MCCNGKESFILPELTDKKTAQLPTKVCEVLKLLLAFMVQWNKNFYGNETNWLRGLCLE